MGGNLFKDKCTPISLENAHIVVDEIIRKIKEKFPDLIILPVGSAGFKKESSDLDIAVLSSSIDSLEKIVKSVFGDDVYTMRALYIISMPYKYVVDRKELYVSVDFIQMVDPQYTYFRYKSPNYLKGESKYKVGTKIMLVGDLLRLSPARLCQLNKDEEAWMDYSPIGLYRHVYKTGEVSNCYYKQFITLDIDEIMNMIFKNPKVEWFDTVESIWEALHTQEVISKEMVKQIELSFFVNCYRKTWEEQVRPEDFRLDYWTLDQVKNALKEQEPVRRANQYLDSLIK